jgi:putative transposase
LKGASSHFVNSEFHPETAFAWQRGYGALTVGERHRSVAEAYVNQQKQHHARQSTIASLEQVEGEPVESQEPMEVWRMIREYSEEYQDIPF